jgi:hypothetical protein
MAEKRKRRMAGSHRSSSSAGKIKTRSALSVNTRDTSRKRLPSRNRLTVAQKEQRTRSFSLLRFRREGTTWREAEMYSGTSVRKAQRYLPKAFYHDGDGHLQVRASDRYVEPMQLPTHHPGSLQVVRARGSRQRSLCGQWSNALKAAGRGNFALIDAFPKDVVIDGYHLTTDHHEVQRIIEAQAESENALEELYALAGTP